MPSYSPSRRQILAAALAAAPGLALDWDSLPTGTPGSDQFDAIVIGAGLGGLSCAAAFARQGFRPLVLEQHDKPGGYATCFRRPGGFVFDASLHSTTVEARNGIRNLIPGFPEITDVEFVAHPSLYRAIFPGHDIRVAQRDLPGYVAHLTTLFPAEETGIRALVAGMQSIASDIERLSALKAPPDIRRFPLEYPHLVRSSGLTWGAMVERHLHDEKLKAIVSALWGYYGLPPSKLASFYYALPTYRYLTQGGYYPKGRSQRISDALVAFIAARGGKVLLRTKVDKVLAEAGAAAGVRTAAGQEYKARVVVANSNPYDLFHSLVEPSDAYRDYLARMDRYNPSLSSFQVFLGLKKDLVKQSGITDTEIFWSPDYDLEAAYRNAREVNLDSPGVGLTLYDNLYPGYSPAGKNTIGLIALHGWEHWKKYEADYRKGNKAAYRKEKERIAAVYIKLAEKLLPGLSGAIEVKEIGTPLTNVRYTGNYRGAIYGWDQTLDNAGQRRFPHTTPLKNLYLSGAWTSPGGGYEGVLISGVQCFGEIMKTWS